MLGGQPLKRGGPVARSPWSLPPPGQVAIHPSPAPHFGCWGRKTVLVAECGVGVRNGGAKFRGVRPHFRATACRVDVKGHHPPTLGAGLRGPWMGMGMDGGGSARGPRHDDDERVILPLSADLAWHDPERGQQPNSRFGQLGFSHAQSIATSWLPPIPDTPYRSFLALAPGTRQ